MNSKSKGVCLKGGRKKFAKNLWSQVVKGTIDQRKASQGVYNGGPTEPLGGISRGHEKGVEKKNAGLPECGW